MFCNFPLDIVRKLDRRCCDDLIHGLQLRTRKLDNLHNGRGDFFGAKWPSDLDSTGRKTSKNSLN